jgi:DNA-binding beta-propeller fold protein YncE
VRIRTLIVAACCLAATQTVLRHAGRAQTPQRLLHAGVPGVGNDASHGGVGVLVLTSIVATSSSSAEGVRGIAAHAATGRLFVSTSRRLAAFDLTRDTIVWRQTYEGKCRDRLAVSPDGRTLYVPAAGAPKWYVVTAETGDVIKTIDKEGSPHNTIYADDGAHAYLASQGKQPPYLSVTDSKTHTIAKNIGPFVRLAM